VQESLLAALQSATAFAGKCSVKTWLAGIPQHKITDTYQRQSREQTTEPAHGDDSQTGDETYANLVFRNPHTEGALALGTYSQLRSGTVL
jgi:DNA-directed RNA polymerase specialized sigma24 family protein